MPSAERAAERLSAQSCVRQSWSNAAADADAAWVAIRNRGAPLPRVPGYTEQSVETASQIGALSLLERYAAIRPGERDAGTAASLRVLQARQRLADHVLLALLDVQGVVAELECERDRGARLAFVLAQGEGRQARRLALAGLVMGAVTAILSGGLALAAPDARGADIVGIVGGGAEAAVGGAGLADDREAPLRIERNLLAEIWHGPSSSKLMPGTIWRILTTPAGSEKAGPSIRDELVEQWRQDLGLDSMSADARSERIERLFGGGGRFSSGELDLRAALIDSLQSRVWLVSVDLERLLREVLRPGEASPAR